MPGAATGCGYWYGLYSDTGGGFELELEAVVTVFEGDLGSFDPSGPYRPP